MGQPDWNKIPFEKMPLWKQEDILKNAKKQVEKLEKLKVGYDNAEQIVEAKKSLKTMENIVTPPVKSNKK